MLPVTRSGAYAPDTPTYHTSHSVQCADGVAAPGKRSRHVRDGPDPGPGRRRRPLTLARWEPSARARMLKALMRYETLSDCTLDVWMLGDDHG